MGNRIGRWQQTRIYVGKCWRLFINERQWKNLVSTLIITVLISFVTSEKTFEDFVQTKNSCFAIICACIWVGIFNSIQSICRERGIIKREHRTGLHISSYIGAHVIFEALLCAVEALIVLAVVLIKNSEHLPESGLVFPMVCLRYAGDPRFLRSQGQYLGHDSDALRADRTADHGGRCLRTRRRCG